MINGFHTTLRQTVKHKYQKQLCVRPWCIYNISMCLHHAHITPVMQRRGGGRRLSDVSVSSDIKNSVMCGQCQPSLEERTRNAAPVLWETESRQTIWNFSTKIGSIICPSHYSVLPAAASVVCTSCALLYPHLLHIPLTATLPTPASRVQHPTPLTTSCTRPSVPHDKPGEERTWEDHGETVCRLLRSCAEQLCSLKLWSVSHLLNTSCVALMHTTRRCTQTTHSCL